MSSKDRILRNLRAHQAPFRDASSRPADYLPVTRLAETERSNLVVRFKTELETLGVKAYLAATPQAAVDQVLSILDGLGNPTAALVWEDLPLPRLAESLAARKIKLIQPNILGSDRDEVIGRADPVRVGITGVDAGFATTGTLVLRSGRSQGRLASLLPPVHVALLLKERIFPRLEDWITAEGYSALTQSSAVVFATGPSRSGDIEFQVVVGVHGPGEVHVVIF